MLELKAYIFSNRWQSFFMEFKFITEETNWGHLCWKDWTFFLQFIFFKWVAQGAEIYAIL